MNRISLVLLHYPVLDKTGNIYTTAITNMDVHDIARSSCTYGLDQYYIVSPIESQRQMAETIASFWLSNSGQFRNPDRSRAMQLICVKESLESSILREKEFLGKKPILIGTSAKKFEDKNISFSLLKNKINARKDSIMLILGTGHGICESIFEFCDFILEPIIGSGDYNHLSVRSAAGIMLDRLLAS